MSLSSFFSHSQMGSLISILYGPLLGTISPSRLKSSGDLLNKIRNINMDNKHTASLNIQSLYANITIKKCILQLKIHQEKNQTTSLIICFQTHQNNWIMHQSLHVKI